ncbi:MAG TPA: flagellar basal body L-ring protein FlgH [Spongiibacteraceae bacterium]|nr:flagellar basal body L-ring protein FlgH [Spongiibacteraceae bacterium]
MGNQNFVYTLLATTLLGACNSSPQPLVVGPTSIRPPYPIATLENPNQGSLYQQATFANIYQDVPLAHKIGDKVKIEISESSSGSNKSSSSLARANSVVTKGPGTTNDSMNSLLKGLLNLNAEASGKDDFSGDGKTENSSTLKGKLAASVINVLPNGNLMVAGERSIAFNGTVNTLRFSGIINPKDIKPDNKVASEDVMEARLEQVGNGLVADSNGKHWIQKMLTDSLLVW